MNKYIIATLISILLFACSGREIKLELFSSDAYAFFLGDSWELNSSVRIKGFFINEEKKPDVRLTYIVNLIQPDSSVIFEADKGELKELNPETPEELVLEVQMNIDSSFASGIYHIQYIMKDEYSAQKDTSVKMFELTSY